MPPALLTRLLRLAVALMTDRAGEPAATLEIEPQIQRLLRRRELVAHYPPRGFQPRRLREHLHVLAHRPLASRFVRCASATSRRFPAPPSKQPRIPCPHPTGMGRSSISPTSQDQPPYPCETAESRNMYTPTAMIGTTTMVGRGVNHLARVDSS